MKRVLSVPNPLRRRFFEPLPGQNFVLGNTVAVEVPPAKHVLGDGAPVLSLEPVKLYPSFVDLTLFATEHFLQTLERLDRLARGRACLPEVQRVYRRLGDGHGF